MVVTQVKERGEHGRFAAGHKPQGGRPKGSTTIRTRVLRDAALLACEAVGEVSMDAQFGEKGNFTRYAMEATGEGGLVGYLKWVAMYHPASMATILTKILPMQVQVARRPTEIFETLDDLKRELDGRGITMQQLMNPPLELEAEETHEDAASDGEA